LSGILQSDQHLNGHVEVPLVIGLSRSKSGKTVGYRDLACLAREYDLPHVSTEDGRLVSQIELIKAVSPTYILVIGWSSLVSSEVLQLPKGQPKVVAPILGYKGAIGMHPTALPIGRGQAPIPWTIINGLEESALSVFFLADQADAGDIVAQYLVTVRPNETSATLFSRFSSLHYLAGQRLAEQIAGLRLCPKPQELSRGSRWPRRNPGDSRLSSTMTIQEAKRLVRAQMGPYPRAFIEDCGKGDGIPITANIAGEIVRFKFSDGWSNLRRVPARRNTEQQMEGTYE
jgi:methionyl-tRNA formyltransferase